MLDIPEIFNQPNNGFTAENLPVVQDKPRWTEFISHLSQFGELDVPSTREQMESLLAFEADPSHRSALMTGIARCIIGEGQLLEGAKLLGYAYSQLPQNDEDSRAFVLLELVAFLAIIGSYDNALMILKSVPTLTNSEYLLRIANYYGLVNVGRKGDPTIIENLKDSAEYFQSIGQRSTLAYHYKNIGNFYGKLEDYRLTGIYYKKALTLVDRPMYKHIRAAIYHDMGMIEFRQGNSEQASDYLQQCIGVADSYYTKSYALGNLGFIYFSNSEYKKAQSYFEKSLNIASTHGVFHLVPGACYYLAECARQLKELSLAGHYFSQGSKTALELAQHKLPLAGERLKVVIAYITFLQENKIGSSAGVGEPDFSFAIGKTLKEIRATFQETLLDEMIHKTGSVKDAISHLEIAERTYSKARERNRKFSIDKNLDCLKVFIRQNWNLNWKEMNRKFDDHILTFLYHRYNLNKKELSENLGVNYSRLVVRFKQIESSWYGSIPNISTNKIESN